MSPDSDRFTPYIIQQMGTAFGTLVGLDDDREVFTTQGLEADKVLKGIVDKHLQLSTALKKGYRDFVDMSGPEFKSWGWISPTTFQTSSTRSS